MKISIYDTLDEAIANGYRPCKRQVCKEALKWIIPIIMIHRLAG